MDVTLHSPEDTGVVVSVGNGDNLNARILLDVVDVGLVVLVGTVVQFVVLVVPYEHVRRNVQCQVAAVADLSRYHAGTLIELLTDIGLCDLTQYKRLDLKHGLTVVDIHMAVDLLTQELVDTVGCCHGAAWLVELGVLAHTVDTALLALVVELLSGLSQDILDKRPLDGVRAFQVQ